MVTSHKKIFKNTNANTAVLITVVETAGQSNTAYNRRKVKESILRGYQFVAMHYLSNLGYLSSDLANKYKKIMKFSVICKELFRTMKGSPPELGELCECYLQRALLRQPLEAT